jgi:hypothetical protein
MDCWSMKRSTCCYFFVDAGLVLHAAFPGAQRKTLPLSTEATVFSAVDAVVVHHAEYGTGKTSCSSSPAREASVSLQWEF